MTSRVIVPPASGRRESLAVAVLVAVILALAALVISLQRSRDDVVALPGWQVDLRSGLNAAEQGLTADLLNAAAEFPYLSDVTPQALADEGLSPFMADAAATARGGHVWTQTDTAARGWLGIPADPGLARPVLLRMLDDAPTVWIADRATTPPDLDDAALIAAGWRQVVTRYDASVTRKDAH